MSGAKQDTFHFRNLNLQIYYKNSSVFRIYSYYMTLIFIPLGAPDVVCADCVDSHGVYLMESDSALLIASALSETTKLSLQEFCAIELSDFGTQSS